MKVKAVREHQNHFGKNFSKEKGEVYLHPRPEADIAVKLVEKADETASITAKRSAAAKAVEGQKAGKPESQKAGTVTSKVAKKTDITSADKAA